MYERILVPADLSDRSLTAVRFGAAIAEASDAELEVLHISPYAVADAIGEVKHRLASLDLPVDHTITVLTGIGVADAIRDHYRSRRDCLMVMSSVGRGRSAAVLGSVATDLLDEMVDPMVVIGPHATEPRPLDGDVLIPVDGSKYSEASIDLAGDWCTDFGATPWIVQVLPADGTVSSDLNEGSYAARLASDLGRAIDRPAQFEVLHGNGPARAISDYASTSGVSLIVMSTHGRTGLGRLLLGSVASGVVHTADCPVVLHRPPRPVAEPTRFDESFYVPMFQMM